MAQPFVIRGLREVNAAFARIERELEREVHKELYKLAQPVAQNWQQRMSRYPGASTSTIKPYAFGRGAIIRQTQKKKTGKRGDFGALQMRHAIGATYDEQDNVEAGIEKLLDWLGRKEGF